MTMVLAGHVENGQIVLDADTALPEGAKVRVEVLAPHSALTEHQTLYERLKPFVGVLEGLPADAASQHDHYIYGTPKKT